ncbi:MAG: RNA polymerase sigma factor [Pseudomonadota bacterium]
MIKVLDESLLVKRSIEGDTRAFETLYRNNVGRVFALCYRLCGERDHAEDYVQETFIKAWQNLPGFNGKSQLSSWLYRIASNVVIDRLRQKKRWQEESLDEICGSELKMVEHNVDTLDIEKKLMTLSEKARAILILYEYLGYKHQEISELTGIPVGTSKSLLNRAKTKLAE